MPWTRRGLLGGVLVGSVLRAQEPLEGWELLVRLAAQEENLALVSMGLRCSESEELLAFAKRVMAEPGAHRGSALRIWRQIRDGALVLHGNSFELQLLSLLGVALRGDPVVDGVVSGDLKLQGVSPESRQLFMACGLGVTRVIEGLDAPLKEDACRRFGNVYVIGEVIRYLLLRRERGVLLDEKREDILERMRLKGGPPRGENVRYAYDMTFYGERIVQTRLLLPLTEPDMNQVPEGEFELELWDVRSGRKAKLKDVRLVGATAEGPLLRCGKFWMLEADVKRIDVATGETRG